MLYLNWNFNHFNLIIKHGHIITSFASDESFNLNHMVLHMDNPTKSTSNSHSKHHTIHAIILPWHNQIEARIKLGSRGNKVVSFDLERRRSGRRNIRKKKKIWSDSNLPRLFESQEIGLVHQKVYWWSKSLPENSNSSLNSFF